MSIPAARETFRKFLVQKGIRVTKQRLTIFDAAFAQPEHFTAEQLLDIVRASVEGKVSRATVYRTLPIMTESALLREVDIGSVTPAAAKALPSSTVSSKLNLTPISQRLQVSAHCNVFRETGTCPRRG